MNDTKKRGRPRSFDPDEALLEAMRVFWTKGYDGASIKDLAEAMGINSPSLYAAFGDKRTLFLKAVERYSSSSSCGPLVAFEEESDIEAGVQAFLRSVVDFATAHPSGTKGCFLTSCVSAVAGSVEGVDELLARSIVETDARLAARFEVAKAAGQLAPEFPSQERARLMFDLRQGFVMRARAGSSREALLQDVAHRVRVVLAWP